LELWEKHWSEQAAKWAVWLSGLVTYEQARQILEEIGGIGISYSSVWRRVEKWGKRFEAIERLQQAKAYRIEASIKIDRNKSLGRMGTAMDGTMIHIREEGWKELKAGSVFEIEKRVEINPKTEEMEEMGHAVNNGYVAHLGGPEVFGKKMWAKARDRHWEYAEDSIVIGDGALWIWNLAGEHFYDSHQLVDWYHASEHLANAAKILHGEGTPKAHRWHRAWESKLYQGHADQIAKKLTQLAKQQPKKSEELLKETKYFRNNHKRMQYLEMREECYPIGSGMVESAAKQYKARFAGPGMRWSREGAQRLLPVRTAIMSKLFDKTWSLAYSSPPN
jgi:hypothetical protein